MARELLQKWVNECQWRGSNMSLLEETKALLAKPEQELSVKLPESEDEAVLMNLLSDNWLRSHAPHRLNQPEQEPVGYLYKQMDCYGEWATIFKVDKPYITWHDIKDIVPVYTAPPKQELLSDLDVFTLYEEAEYIGFLAYRKGIKDAEKAHGIIGVKGDE